MKRFALATLAALVLASPCLAAEPHPRFERRWFYLMTNLMVDAEADKVVALLDRAGKAGYNGLVLADYKLNLLDQVQPNYFPNIARVQKAAAKAKIEIIPTVFPIGYSNGLLMHDTNLAEGLEVKDAPFVVKGGEAVFSPDPNVKVRGGDMEQAKGDTIVGFGYQDDPGKASFVDRDVKHSGKSSLRIADPPGNCRLITSVNLRPHGCYRMTAWVKTKGFTQPGNFRLMAIGHDGKSLSFVEGGVEKDQDWKRVEVIFNSLNSAEVNLYGGVYGGSKGTLWMDDFQIEEMGLVNVLRREGTPFTVKSADGRTAYEEGKDFDRVADAKLGRVPYAGEYEFGHEPAKLKVSAGSRIKDGDKLRVGWYHPVLTVGGQIMCCLSEPKVYDLLRDQAERVQKLLKPKAVFMSHDEIRVANWCALCQSRKMTPGALLADNVKQCRQILKETMPEAEVLVWSDMFDPHHNAINGYYLVNGTLADSWNGLDRDVTIANWNGGHAAESLKFFANRGHRQVIAGYYDADDLSNFRTWDAASKGVPKVDGFMYTTWERKLNLLETYGEALR